jgi:hypothetical protein
MEDGAIVLRESTDADDEIFYAQQLDPRARAMAAAVGKDAGDLAAWLARGRRIAADPKNLRRTVLSGGRVAGYVASFMRGDEREDRFFSERRGVEVEEFVLKLEEAA